MTSPGRRSRGSGRNLGLYSLGILAGSAATASVLILIGQVIPASASGPLRIVIIVAGVIILLESLAGKRRQPPQPSRQLAPGLLLPASAVGTIAYGSLVGVGFKIRLQNYLPILAGALILIEGGWTIGLAVATGWTLGHAAILVAPLTAAREPALPSEHSQLVRLRAGSSISVVAFLVFALLAPI